MEKYLIFTALAISVTSIYLGLFKLSHRVALKTRLEYDAVFIRHGLFTWELLICLKGKKVGIKQGISNLPSAKRKVKEFEKGARSLLPL